MRFLLLTGLLFTLNLHGGTMVGNGSPGGGASEMAVTYAHQNYATLVEPCWKTAACQLTVDENSLLQSLLSEPSTPLQFLSSQELGNAVYKTDPKVGSAILINKDKLWKPGANGDVTAYSVPDGVALLTLAWSEHYSAKGVEMSLSNKLASFLNVKRTIYLLNLTSPNLRALTFKGYASDMMVLDDGFDRFMLVDGMIKERISCVVTRLLIYTFQWQPRAESSEDVLLGGHVGWNCQHDPALHGASVILDMKVDPASDLAHLRLTPDDPTVLLSNIH